MIHAERIKKLNENSFQNRRYVLYWMQASQRSEYNHALEAAILKADELNKPLVVFFGITDEFPEANERHYAFMLEGLAETQKSLADRKIKMVIRRRSPEKGVIELAGQADLVFVDRGYLKIQRSWRQYAAQNIDCPLFQVESDVVVPIETASGKEEYAARTIRPKIDRILDIYLIPLQAREPRLSSLDLDLDSLDIGDIDRTLSRLHIDRSVKAVHGFRGGTSVAKKRFEEFLNNRLDRYSDLRNDPSLDYLSDMSPYLHFGQISPLYLALKVLQTDSPGRKTYLEELIVRRELSMNYVFYNRQYDSYDGLPAWARKSLEEHEYDLKTHLYTLDRFENARTHDPYWNAAQKEMVLTGKMHGYMRMYWGKKILEWSKTPREAFDTALYLNNKYELDGRDPNGFTGVAWCFGKHDRPWIERQIFGKIRYMNANGLKRKFDADAYVKKIESLDEKI